MRDICPVVYNRYIKFEQAEAKGMYEAFNHKYALNKVLMRIEQGKQFMDESSLPDIHQTIHYNILFVGGY